MNCATEINSTTRNACGCRMYVVTRKHGNPTQKLKWFPRDKTMLVKVQASLNISKPERGHFFSCSSPAVTDLRCCAIYASFETSVIARDSHLHCSEFLLSASNDDGALGDKKPMQIVYLSFSKM